MRNPNAAAWLIVSIILTTILVKDIVDFIQHDVIGGIGIMSLMVNFSWIMFFLNFKKSNKND
jgi:hypothetical protein